MEEKEVHNFKLQLIHSRKLINGKGGVQGFR
jgi:hypothetical protein